MPVPETVQAFVPLAFFRELLPYNAELIKGNAMVLRACGAKPDDGSVLRSREYLLFGNGIATLIAQAHEIVQGFASVRPEMLERYGEAGYLMDFTRKQDARRVVYWEVHASRTEAETSWRLEATASEPNSGNYGHIRMLAGSNGAPGQFFFLSCPTT